MMKVDYGSLGSVFEYRRKIVLPDNIGGSRPPSFVQFDSSLVIQRGVQRLKHFTDRGIHETWIEFGCVDWGISSHRVEFCLGHFRYSDDGIDYRTACSKCLTRECRIRHDPPMFTILEKRDWITITELARKTLLRNYNSFLETIPA